MRLINGDPLALIQKQSDTLMGCHIFFRLVVETFREQSEAPCCSWHPLNAAGVVLFLSCPDAKEKWQRR